MKRPTWLTAVRSRPASEARYGRTLAYLWSSDVLINAQMIAEGMAVVATYPPNVKYVDQMLPLQAQAREEGRGLWSVDGFDCTPADFRTRGGGPAASQRHWTRSLHPHNPSTPPKHPTIFPNHPSSLAHQHLLHDHPKYRLPPRVPPLPRDDVYHTTGRYS